MEDVAEPASKRLKLESGRAVGVSSLTDDEPVESLDQLLEKQENKTASAEIPIEGQVFFMAPKERKPLIRIEYRALKWSKFLTEQAHAQHKEMMVEHLKYEELARQGRAQDAERQLKQIAGFQSILAVPSIDGKRLDRIAKFLDRLTSLDGTIPLSRTSIRHYFPDAYKTQAGISGAAAVVAGVSDEQWSHLRPELCKDDGDAKIRQMVEAAAAAASATSKVTTEAKTTASAPKEAESLAIMCKRIESPIDVNDCLSGRPFETIFTPWLAEFFASLKLTTLADVMKLFMDSSVLGCQALDEWIRKYLCYRIEDDAKRDQIRQTVGIQCDQSLQVADAIGRKYSRLLAFERGESAKAAKQRSVPERKAAAAARAEAARQAEQEAAHDSDNDDSGEGDAETHEGDAGADDHEEDGDQDREILTMDTTVDEEDDS